MFGYNPSWSFERGIRAAIEWYKENQWNYTMKSFGVM
jgi:dTDP-D-glucose 4,6-dehydratase